MGCSALVSLARRRSSPHSEFLHILIIWTSWINHLYYKRFRYKSRYLAVFEIRLPLIQWTAKTQARTWFLINSNIGNCHALGRIWEAAEACEFLFNITYIWASWQYWSFEIQKLLSSNWNIDFGYFTNYKNI